MIVSMWWFSYYVLCIFISINIFDSNRLSYYSLSLLLHRWNAEVVDSSLDSANEWLGEWQEIWIPCILLTVLFNSAYSIDYASYIKNENNYLFNPLIFKWMFEWYSIYEFCTRLLKQMCCHYCLVDVNVLLTRKAA